MVTDTMSVRGCPVAGCTVIGSHRPRGRSGRIERAAAILLVQDDLVLEVLHRGGDRHRRGVAEGAEGPPEDVVAHVEARLQSLLRSLAVLQALDGADQPVGDLRARRALAAGLVL